MHVHSKTIKTYICDWYSNCLMQVYHVFGNTKMICCIGFEKEKDEKEEKKVVGRGIEKEEKKTLQRNTILIACSNHMAQFHFWKLLKCADFIIE